MDGIYQFGTEQHMVTDKNLMILQDNHGELSDIIRLHVYGGVVMG